MIRKIMEMNKKRRAVKALFLYENMFFLPNLCEFFSYSVDEVNNMTEEEELKQLQAEMQKKKQKIERKYSKIAKKRLQQINKIVSPDRLIVDMNDAEFKELMVKINRGAELYLNEENKTIDIDENDLPFNKPDQSSQENGQNGQVYQGEQNYQ